MDVTVLHLTDLLEVHVNESHVVASYKNDSLLDQKAVDEIVVIGIMMRSRCSMIESDGLLGVWEHYIYLDYFAWSLTANWSCHCKEDASIGIFVSRVSEDCHYLEFILIILHAEVANLFDYWLGLKETTENCWVCLCGDLQGALLRYFIGFVFL